jgi:CRP/FNR family transcriptional regulator, cyclic AMP receptor protein
MPGIYEFVAKAPIFKGLDSAQLELIAACAGDERVPAGTLVGRQGEAADRFFIIGEGTIALQVESPGSGPVRLLTLDQPEVVGWSWLFAPYRWMLDVRAVTDCHLITVDGIRLRGECDADHDLGYELVTRFGAAAVVMTKDTWYQLINLTVRQD